MANAVPSRLGQANLSGASDALFLKVFAGEAITRFKEKNVALERTRVRTITSGKSASFPQIGKGSAHYHTPGAELPGTTLAQNERIISIDDMLVAERFIAEIDEAKNHFDVRQEYSSDVGEALANTMDNNILRIGIIAARTSSNITGLAGGSVITAATAGTNADVLIAAAFDAAQAFDEKDVPEEERFFYVRPDQYYNLVNSGSKLIHTDYNPGQTNGSVAMGKVSYVAGMPIVKTNHLPSTNVTSSDTAVTTYQGDFSTTVALAMQRRAVGTVKLIDVSFRMSYDERRLGTLIVSKCAVGHGVLDPRCAVEVKTA